VKGAVTDMVVKIMEENPGEHAEACTALESLFKDLGESPFAIKVSAQILQHEYRIVLPALQTIFHPSQALTSNTTKYLQNTIIIMFSVWIFFLYTVKRLAIFPSPVVICFH
jgi:hypothetical protein